MADLGDQERVAALMSSGLLNREEQWRLDTLCETAAALLRVPLAMVNVFKGDTQHSVGKFPVEGIREMPVADSGCKHVVEADAVVSIPNTLLHPVMCLSPLVTVTGVRSYLGQPVRHQGLTVGTFCVADFQVRHWTHWDIEGLQSLGRMAGFSVDQDG